MQLLDLIYFLAYGLFLAGAYVHLCRSMSRAGLWIMVAAVVIDFFATVLPSTGFKSLAIGIGSSPAIVAGIVLCVFIWVLFLASVFIRLSENMRLYAGVIAVLKVLWFGDLVLFVYGVYRL